MDVFNEYYDTNFWGSEESLSGHGSTMEQTAVIRELLPEIISRFNVKTMLDIPCGDFNWMRAVPLNGVNYLGADIVEGLVEKNKRYATHTDVSQLAAGKIAFTVLDMTKDDLPKVDLILARDVLGHFSNADVRLALANLRRSGSRWLLTTMFPDEVTEGDIVTGKWRPINLASFFGMPDPLHFWPEINVEFPDGHTSVKGLGLWDLGGNL